MPTFARRTTVPVSAKELFAWHDRPGAFERLAPPWQHVERVESEGIRDGDCAELRVRAGPFSFKWKAEHRDYEQDKQFRDVQVSGPFARWEHTHRILPHDLDLRKSVLEDRVEYELPLSRISTVIAGRKAEREMVRMFAYRHRVTCEDLVRHTSTGLRPLTIAMTGSSGLIGCALSAFLLSGGHTVVRMLRSPAEVVRNVRSNQERAALWNPDAGFVDAGSFAGVDAVIHLAGEPVLDGPWTRDRRAKIMDSRARATRLLSETLASMPSPPNVLISASGTAIYGDRGDERLTEASPPGEGFLSDVCKAWEAATEPAAEAGIRVCTMRLGAVLTPQGGLLQIMRPAFFAGLGGTVGRGNSWVPWIAIDDVLYATLHLLASDELTGPVNLVAPHTTTQRALSATLADLMRRPALLRVPSTLVRLAAGRQARDLAVSSARVVPEKLANSAFRFAYPRLEDALAHVLGRAASVAIEDAQ